MKEITLKNLLNTEENVSEWSPAMDTVLRETRDAADTLSSVADLVERCDEDDDGVVERLHDIERWYSEKDCCRLRIECREYFKALAWLIKNTTICEQVAAKFHDTLKFNVERAAEKMLTEIQIYDY